MAPATLRWPGTVRPCTRLQGGAALTRFFGPIAWLAASSALAVGGCGGSSHEATTTASNATPRTDRPATTHARAHHPRTRAAADPSSAHPGPGPHRHGTHGHPTTTASRLTVSELRQRANAACATARRKEAAFSRPGDFNTNPGAAASYLERLSSAQAAEIMGLHQNPPTSVAVRYSELVGNVLHQQLLIGTAGAQARSGKRGYVQTYASAVSYGRISIHPLARQLDLPSCG
jgi:hypothetical protein